MKIRSGDKIRTIIQTDESTYLISGESRFLIRSLNDPMDRVEFECGPRLCVGRDFYGKGKIVALEPVAHEKGNKSVRVKVCAKTS